jgi:hypothetical protein
VLDIRGDSYGANLEINTDETNGRHLVRTCLRNTGGMLQESAQLRVE